MTRPIDMTAGMQAALQGRAQAWRFLTDFAACWRAPLQAGDGYDPAMLDAAEHRLGLRLPPALREAYMLLGRRDDLCRNQDRLLRPEELHVCQGALVYHAENQGVAHWGVLLDDLAGEDPPAVVWLDLANKAAERWQPWNARLSVALVELVMSESALYDGDGLSDGADLPDGVLGMFEPLPALLPAGNGYDSAWFAGDDLLVHVNDGCWLTVRARSSEALDAVRDAVPGDWVNW
jgi:hypothetical protein